MSRPPPLPRFPRCVSWDGGRKETGHPLGGPFRMKCRRWPTLPRPLGRSTIGAVGLNDRVRDGNGCGPYALIASDFFVRSSAISRQPTTVDVALDVPRRHRASESFDEWYIEVSD